LINLVFQFAQPLDKSGTRERATNEKPHKQNASKI